MEYLVTNGVRFGEGGISHTVARGRRTYYLCMSGRNRWLHRQYSNMIKVDEKDKKDKKDYKNGESKVFSHNDRQGSRKRNFVR